MSDGQGIEDGLSHIYDKFDQELEVAACVSPITLMTISGIAPDGFKIDDIFTDYEEEGSESKYPEDSISTIDTETDFSKNDSDSMLEISHLPTDADMDYMNISVVPRNSSILNDNAVDPPLDIRSYLSKYQTLDETADHISLPQLTDNSLASGVTGTVASGFHSDEPSDERESTLPKRRAPDRKTLEPQAYYGELTREFDRLNLEYIDPEKFLNDVSNCGPDDDRKLNDNIKKLRNELKNITMLLKLLKVADKSSESALQNDLN